MATRPKKMLAKDEKAIEKQRKATPLNRRKNPIRGISVISPEDLKVLKPQEARFVVEYMKDYIGSAAAKRAGYTGQMGHILLHRPSIIAAIDHYEKNLATRFIYSKNKVLKELSIIANSDISDYVEVVDGVTYLKDIGNLPPQVSRAIKKIRGFRKVVAVQDKKGGYTGEDIIENRLEIELHDKLAALRDIGKEIGMFKEKIEFSNNSKKPVIIKVVYENEKQAPDAY